MTNPLKESAPYVRLLLDLDLLERAQTYLFKGEGIASHDFQCWADSMSTAYGLRLKEVEEYLEDKMARFRGWNDELWPAALTPPQEEFLQFFDDAIDHLRYGTGNSPFACVRQHCFLGERHVGLSVSFRVGVTGAVKPPKIDVQVTEQAFSFDTHDSTKRALARLLGSYATTVQTPSGDLPSFEALPDERRDFVCRGLSRRFVLALESFANDYDFAPFGEEATKESFRAAAESLIRAHLSGTGKKG